MASYSHRAADCCAALLAALLICLTDIAFGQTPPQGPPKRIILSPAETVGQEHADRKRRLQRLATGLESAPQFFEYFVPNAEHKLPDFPGALGVLRLVFDTRVFFDFDRADLGGRASKVFDVVVESLRREPPDVVLVVAGHTDSVGTDEYNYDLGLRRAQTVAASLVERGIPSIKVYRVSFGKHAPIADNTTDAGRARNRRVEFFFSARKEAIMEVMKDLPRLCDVNDKTQDNICSRKTFEVASVTPGVLVPPVDRGTLTPGGPKETVSPAGSKTTIEVGKERITLELSERRFTIDEPGR